MSSDDFPRLATLQWAAAIPAVGVADAASGAGVKIVGRAVASEQGTLVSPFSGRAVVWSRVRLSKTHVVEVPWHGLLPRGIDNPAYWDPATGDDLLQWRVEFDETSVQAFLVDDGSGELARVYPYGARAIVATKSVAECEYLNSEPSELQAFMRARGHLTSMSMGSDRDTRFEEAALAPGDRVTVVGLAQRRSAAPVSDGYRSLPSSELVFEADPEAGQWLYLCDEA
jgi:hypothetical protein